LTGAFKRSARLNAMGHLLHKLPYTNKDANNIGALDSLIVGCAHVGSSSASARAARSCGVVESGGEMSRARLGQRAGRCHQSSAAKTSTAEKLTKDQLAMVRPRNDQSTLEQSPPPLKIMGTARFSGNDSIIP
jgi:hypothetical protein